MHSVGGGTTTTGGGTNRIVSDETRNKLSIATSKQIFPRKVEKSKGLPRYMTYFKDERYEGYKIQKHPNCSYAGFFDSTKTLKEPKIFVEI